MALAVVGLASEPRTEAEVVSEPDVPGCPRSGAVPDAKTSEPAKQAVLCLLNAERARHGLGYLVRDASLDLASQRHSEDMAARNFFEHDTPEGIGASSRMAGAGYPAYHTTTAENLYWGEDEKSTPVRAHRSWMRSPGHRANILLPELRVVGIGIAYETPLPGRGDHQAAVYTTDFGSR